MERNTQVDVKQFNDELLQLVKAGLPVQINGLDGERSRLAEALSKWELEFFNAETQGSLQTHMVGSASNLPKAYGHALLNWNLTRGSIESFEILVAPAQRQKQSSDLIKFSYTQPAILLCIAYVVLIVLCYTSIPGVEAIYKQLNIPYSVSLTIVTTVRDFMFLWGPLFPVVLFWIVWRQRQVVRHLPLSKVFENEVTSDSFQHYLVASEIASLIDANAPADDWSEEAKGLRTLHSDVNASEDWRKISESYRAMSQMRYELAKGSFSKLTLVTWGGAIVLVVALIVFFPLAELLFKLGEANSQ